MSSAHIILRECFKHREAIIISHPKVAKSCHSPHQGEGIARLWREAESAAQNQYILWRWHVLDDFVVARERREIMHKLTARNKRIESKWAASKEIAVKLGSWRKSEMCQ